MAKSTKKTTPVKASSKKTKAKAKLAQKLIPTRKLGLIMLVCTLILTVAHIANYGIENLRFDGSVLFMVTFFCPLIFCALFLLARPGRSSLFLSIMGAGIAVAYSILPVSILAHAVQSTYGFDLSYSWGFAEFIAVLVVIVPIVLGVSICIVAIKKGNQKTPEKIIGTAGSVIGFAVLLSVIVVVIVANVLSVIRQNEFKALQNTAISVIWPDDTQQELRCSAPSCTLGWQNSEYFIEIERQDYQDIYNQSTENGELGSAVLVSVFPLANIDGDERDWPEYYYSAAIFDGEIGSFEQCTSFHNYNDSKNSGVVFPGEEDPLLDESPDCTRPFETVIKNNTIHIKSE